MIRFLHETGFFNIPTDGVGSTNQVPRVGTEFFFENGSTWLALFIISLSIFMSLCLSFVTFFLFLFLFLSLGVIRAASFQH